jgi:hypothetical protein
MITLNDTRTVSVTPTVDTLIYAAKDCIGGLLTFPNIISSRSRCGIIRAVTITDRSDNAVAYELVVFKSQPTGTFTDQAPFDPADADLPLISPVISIPSANHYSFNDNGVSSVSGLSSIVVSDTASANTGNMTLYACLITRGTPTYANAADVTVTITVTSE